MLGGGDSLARGAKSAQFGTGGKNMTDKAWQAMFKKKKKKKAKTKCPAVK